jgi:two-component system, OmpR family, sensor histidine kinase KdpD
MVFQRTTHVTGTLLGVLLVAATSAVCAYVFPVNATTAGFAYLIVVLAVAARWGFIEAVVTSVVAVLSLNYLFFEPVGTLNVSDPHNWAALIAFLVTSLVAGHLSNRLKRQTAEIAGRQRETEQLYAFSKAMLLMDTSRPAGIQTAERIAQTFQCSGVSLFDASSGNIYRIGDIGATVTDDSLRLTAADGVRRTTDDIVILPIALGSRPVGGLALKHLTCSDGVLKALVNLVAIAIEREQSAGIASQAEAARQSQEFKSTLLDAIAHEFKTPLTSIKAASTSILSASPSPTGSLRELADIIDEEADRLTTLVTDAVRISQIEAGQVRIEKRPVKLAPFIREIVTPYINRAEGRSITVDVADGLPLVPMDPQLIALALRQIVDNAIKYSPADSPVLVRGCANNGSVEIRVIDAGPGVSMQDRERIFERYYRRKTSPETVPGTGIGLYVAREIVRAHGGDLWLGNVNRGSEFCISLAKESA